MTGIVIGVDGSDGATLALEWAVEEGRGRGWPVTAVLAWDFLSQAHADRGAPFDPDYDETHAAEFLDGYLERALGAAAPGVGRVVVNDKPAQALLGAATGADLLVVGARGLGGFKGLVLGSVSRTCLEHATVPTAVIHAPAEGAVALDPQRIVVGTDGSHDAGMAMRWAADEARARGAVLEVVHAWQLPLVGGYLDGAPQFDASAIEEYAERTLTDAVADLDTSGLAHPVETRLATGGAAGALVEASETASLVVVGHRGLGRIAGFLLGATSLRVAQHSSCPVVVVPHTE